VLEWGGGDKAVKAAVKVGLILTPPSPPPPNKEHTQFERQKDCLKTPQTLSSLLSLYLKVLSSEMDPAESRLIR
jgi:hypothetical protein